MHDLGLPEQAPFFLDRAYENMGDDEEPLPGTTSSIILNFFAFSLWLRRAKLHGIAIQSGNPQINREDQRAIVAEAFYFALLAKRLLSAVEVGDDSLKEVTLNIANNLICYLWELRDLSRNHDEFLELVRDIVEDVDIEQDSKFPHLPTSKSAIEEIAEPLIKIHDDQKIPRRFADTLMKYYHLTGDVEKLEVHRSQLRDILKIEGSSTKQEEQNDLFMYSIDRTKGREDAYALAVRLEL